MNDLAINISSENSRLKKNFHFSTTAATSYSHARIFFPKALRKIINKPYQEIVKFICLPMVLKR